MTQSTSSQNIYVGILSVCLCLTILMIVDLNVSKSTTLRALKKITKELNNERISKMNFEKLHKASLVMNVFPVVFSNEMLNFCENLSENICPYNHTIFNHLHRLDSYFASQNFDFILNFASKYGLNSSSSFKQVVKALKTLRV